MVIIDGVTCEVIAKGISYGIAPKIGDNALIISTMLRVSDWQFNLSRANLDKGEYWFQCVSNGEFIWSHGIVNESGKILQIG